MIQDCAEYNWEAFSMALGEQAAETIKYGKKIAYCQFGIEIEVSPDEEEKMNIEQMLQLGLQNQTLFVSDAIRIRQELKHSSKLAAQLLVLLENKNKEDKIKESMSLQEQNAAVQQQSTQVASQMKQQEMQLEVQSKGQLLELEYTFKDTFEQKQFERQMALQQLKNEGAYTVAEINTDGKVNVQKDANEGKIVASQIAAQSKEKTENIKHHAAMVKGGADHESKMMQEKLKNETKKKAE